MIYPTSRWFASLTSRERKALVCLLFEVTRLIQNHSNYRLFREFLGRLDDEYHSLK